MLCEHVCRPPQCQLQAHRVQALSFHLQALVMGMTLLVAGFLVLLPLPGGVAPSLPWVAALWAALLAVTLGIQVQAACVRSCDFCPRFVVPCLCAMNEQ